MENDYRSTDTIDELSAEQLELIVRTESDLLLRVIGDTTLFDVQRIRLMLELGQVEAKRRLEILPSNAALTRRP